METIEKEVIEKFDFFKIKANEIEYVFSSCGASLYSLKVNNKDLILSLSDKEFFLKSPQYFNKTLGLVAGRIKSNFIYDNKEFSFLDTGDEICLHGGHFNSLSFKNWNYKIKEFKNKIEVKFSISSIQSKKAGFTAKNKIYVIYDLYKNKNGFKIKFKVNVKEDTFLNLSNHIYWNLNSSKDINDYYLKFNASNIGKVNDELLIVDTIVTPSYLSFKRKSKLKPHLDEAKKLKIGTIDNTFIFDDKINKVLLENNEYKIKMKTDYKAMNIYCDSSMTDVKFNNRSELKERRAIALEPQLYVYDLSSIYFKKGDKYNHFIEYIIIEK